MSENKGKSPQSEREEKVLEFWEKEKIFEKTLEKQSPKGEFVFYEGPPTANGRPGIHHLEARAFKDAIPRYRTMRGYHVRRKGGWDTHGLPVELEVEKQLGLSSKKDIEKYGVADFNKKCKESVLKYLEEWSSFTKRIGYWTDQENAYFTFHNSYIESLWNVVGRINEQNLLYKDYRIAPWCPRCGTGLSSHELAQGYQDDTDISLYVKFKLKGEENTYILAWTTTPWTLAGNVALAVGEDVEYVKVKKEDKVYVTAKGRLELLGEGLEILENIKGKDLVGLEYEPLFPYLKDNLPDSEKEKFPNAFKVYAGDFVTTTDGTGVVHIAPMYGQDDFELATKNNLPKFHIVGEDGLYKDFCGDLSGRFVKERDVNQKPTLDVDIIKYLQANNFYFDKENYKHSYPHCWRCKTHLIYYARDSWYIRMSELREKLVSENQKINWEPSHIKDGRFGEWLREIKDWAISRERYWGTPLPVWTDEKGSKRVVVDSIETLKKYTKKSGNKYILMRHGEAEHNVLGIFSSDGEKSHSLTEQGISNLKETAEKLKEKNIDIIFSSPLRRATETVGEVKKIIGEKDVVVDERLREEDFGELSGLKYEEFAKHFPTFENRLTESIKGSESLLSVRNRIGEFIYEIEKKYKDKTILIVTHDGPAKMFKVIKNGASQKDIKSIYHPGENFLSVGEFIEFDFCPIPHNNDFELDLHKPYIDEVELADENGDALKRVKEVMDVWFDSGAMPFAQDHYPFENKDLAFPADFISEAIDQTRGWFYTLHAVGNLLGKGFAYKNVICLGHLLDKDGKKMSKSLGNVVNPFEMIEKYGVDALRLWMYSVNQPGESKNFDEKTVDEIVKKYFNLLSNVHSFYELFRDESLESNNYPESKNVLDRWILSCLNKLIESSTKDLDGFKLLEPVRATREFIDDLSTWYLRRSRDRIKSGDVDAKKTLYFVLKTLSKLLAPFAPFYADDLFQKLKKESDSESVHLENWPEEESFDEELIKKMESIRNVVTLSLEQRSKSNIKVRQPLSKLTISGIDLDFEIAEPILKDEINVKSVEFVKSEEVSVSLETSLTEELKEEGIAREIIRFVQDMRKKANLVPSDEIILSIKTDEKGLKIVENQNWQKMIKDIVGAKEIKLADIEGEQLSVDGFEFTLKI